jgi:hypothetical protein
VSNSSFLRHCSAAAAVGSLITGCAAPIPPGAERGPHGTMAYLVPVDASDPGVTIYVNGQKAGVTPLTLKIFGDPDGTFHDFGSYEFVVQAVPLKTNQFVQTRVFQTGKMFTPEDRIPDRIHFDMNQPPPPQPTYVPVPAYPPPAYYYGPPYYYYGPRLYIGPPTYRYPHHHW